MIEPDQMQKCPGIHTAIFLIFLFSL
uniref:Uncharacterized protein n=1 Tax=Rhizophora mucronata TaxID=61149 RepID=A0A2P2P9F9_RHIMU